VAVVGKQRSDSEIQCYMHKMIADERVLLMGCCSRHCIAIVDLSSPQDVVRRIARHGRWAISCVAWNPHRSHADYFLTAVCICRVFILLPRGVADASLVISVKLLCVSPGSTRMGDCLCAGIASQYVTS